MTNRIRVRAGNIEVEYEGEEDFLKGQLQEAVLSFLRALTPLSEGLEKPAVAGAGSTDIPSSEIQGTTANIAARLDARTGPDLALAAAAHLGLGKGLQTFSRKALLQEMKSTTQYYRPSYSANLTRIITSLTKENKLNEPSSGNLSLTAAAEKELRVKLAES